ncbi:YidC/Oxa1 family membrane protein insertase [Lederbergia citri]|nr:YidC/Oxa1 family membrane protein insertase [Lederbergia citri]
MKYKSGYIELKIQREINEKRQEKTKKAYEQLQKEVKELLKKMSR